ncbi:TonB-dependent siderophore receptor [Rodentibacter genomosp. 2]|uniref:TonB-dependent siderophore receptor n=1 Tax=Rodentibacter genomosp. 2 TaxID=1908266 RepID=A0A1V3JGL8_9PAST|nr:TonB-dependent siderophore receptor [Rodentibacter genomosp. 2]OOF55589.1 TonB-dependent siderophore receptor [Rodentibacter genomosp. 2]
MQGKQFSLTNISFVVMSVLTASAVLANTDSSTTLDEITVTDRQGTKVQTNIVTMQERNESTATDLRSFLAKEPSIDFGGGNGTSQFLTIRGMGQNSVDIKVDNAYSDSQILYHQGRFIIDPALLKSVSVQKGAGSASAGIGATNGAIIAKTVDALDLLKGSDKDYGFRLNTGFSSNDSYSYGATAFGKSGNFDALVSYARTDDDNYKPGKGYRNIDGGDAVPYSALDKRNYLIKLGGTFGDGNHRLVLSHLKDEHRGVRTVREEFTVSQHPTDPKARLTLEGQAPTYRETSKTNTNLEYTGKNLGFVKELTANAYIMQDKRYSADDSKCGYCGNVEGPTTTKITTKGANVNFDSDIGDAVLLKYGLNYRHQKITPHAFLPTTARLQQLSTKISKNISRLIEPTKEDTGAYIEAISALGDFTFTTGLRYDHFKVKTTDGKSVSSGKFNPSFGVIWQATDELSFSATHNYATRSPRLYDALTTHGKRGIISIADGTVAERARNTEIGFNYNYAGFSLEGSYFWQRINDALANPQNRHPKINRNDKDELEFKETVNAGVIKNHGYEINAGYTVGGFTARVGVAESKPRIYDNDPSKKLLSSNPEFAVQIGRTWTAELSYRFEEPNLELGWRNRTVQKAKGSVLVRDNETGSDIVRSGYSVHDFYVNWKPLNNDQLNINVSLNNAFNKFYYPHSQRPNVLPGVGRELRVGINYQF